MGTARRLLLLGFAAAMLAGGCRRETVVLRAASPRGGGEALVVERAWLDPPDQTLVLEPPDHRTRIVLTHLAPDAEGCSEIAWAGDGGRVAFLVSGRRLLVFDRGGNEVADLAPLDPEVDGGRVEVRRIGLSGDGRVVEYEVCAGRGGERCSARRSRALGSAAAPRSGP